VGPARGLYLAILLKRDDPSHQVTVYERNRVEDTFGFACVLRRDLENVGEADPETNQAMALPGALGGYRDPLRGTSCGRRPSLLRSRAEDPAGAACGGRNH